MATADLERIKIIIREEDIPFFTEDEIIFYLEENNGNVNATIYQCLIIKSEDSTIAVSGLSTADSSGYFKRLASRYKVRNSGILLGGE